MTLNQRCVKATGWTDLVGLSSGMPMAKIYVPRTVQGPPVNGNYEGKMRAGQTGEAEQFGV